MIWLHRTLAAMLAAALAACATPARAPDTRHSGFHDMGAALQAMQLDDAQNPASLWVADGAALWTREPQTGRACAACHDAGLMRDAATRYPAFNAARGRPLSLPERVDQCRVQHQGATAEGADGAEVLALSAWLARQARGLSIAPPPDPRLAPWRERGEQIWRQRMGQLNLSCAQCHDERAGQRLGGAPIPQAHPVGYPVYRLEWQTLGSLERRMRGCLVGVRAEAYAPGADEWAALEVFLMQRAAGMAHEGTAVRP
jgi:L-cysteine S-thiosulfotransferase